MQEIVTTIDFTTQHQKRRISFQSSTSQQYIYIPRVQQQSCNKQASQSQILRTLNK